MMKSITQASLVVLVAYQLSGCNPIQELARCAINGFICNPFNIIP